VYFQVLVYFKLKKEKYLTKITKYTMMKLHNIMQDNNRRKRFNSSTQSGSRFRPSRTSKPFGSSSQPRKKAGQQLMKPDFDLFIKKARMVEVEEYKPIHTFDTFGLNNLLVTTLKARGYSIPTPIQDSTIPHLLEKKDIIGIANTGTGKTAAFLLPLIHHSLDDKNRQTLILAPTRELAMQIQDELMALAKNANIRSSVVVGGMPMNRQIQNLRKSQQFVVGTTGRTLDLVNQGFIKLGNFDAIVLDEMDQMLDMGFLPDIQKILEKSKPEKQLLFFSATMDKRIEGIAHKLLKNPVSVSVKTGVTTDNVEQDVVRHAFDADKTDILHGLIVEHKIEKAIIFDNMKHAVKNLEKKLHSMGHRVVAIHGNKTQAQRKRALDDFKVGRANILIATNVAARGLDIPNVSHVYNFSLPQSREDYIHRIGRTGRAGKKGFAFTFVPK
jgi:ATP-dependent RNA helicase RhlE